MAVVVLLELPNTTMDQYERLFAEAVGEAGTITRPELVHLAGASGSSVRVITAWESESAFQNFAQNVMFPAAQKVGVGGQPKISTWQMDKALTPTGSLL